MTKSIATTTEVIRTLEADMVSLDDAFSREKTQMEDILEKLCREHEEAERHFRDKTHNLEVRLNKSRSILDELVNRRFAMRDQKMRYIKDLEDQISNTRLNIQKVNRDTELILERIAKEINTRILSVLIT